MLEKDWMVFPDLVVRVIAIRAGEDLRQMRNVERYVLTFFSVMRNMFRRGSTKCSVSSLALFITSTIFFWKRSVAY